MAMEAYKLLLSHTSNGNVHIDLRCHAYVPLTSVAKVSNGLIFDFHNIDREQQNFLAMTS